MAETLEQFDLTATVEGPPYRAPDVRSLTVYDSQSQTRSMPGFLAARALRGRTAPNLGWEAGGFMKLRTTFSTVAATLAVAVAITGGAGPASASESDPSVTQATAAVYQVAPSVLAGVASVLPSTSADAVIDQVVDGTSIEVPRDPADGVTIDSPTAPAFSIGLPFAGKADDATLLDGVVAYDNNNGTVTLPVVKDDGSVQVLTTIEDANAPTRFEYKLDLPAGATLYVDEFGGAYVLGADGVSLVTSVAPAWATDANGQSVPTHYETNGNALVQVVEHCAAKTAYPVVADPWWGLQYKVSATSANKIIAAMATGGGAAAIAALICTGTIVGIPCGVALGVATGLIAIGGGVVAWCNAAGRGININTFWNGWMTCTSR